MIRAYIDVLIAIFTIIVVFFISIRMRGTFTRLVEDVTSRVAKPQRANELVESFLYIVTLVIIATTTLLVSFPLIERTFGGVIGELGSGVLVAVIIIIFLLFVWSSARGAAQRLEDMFEIH